MISVRKIGEEDTREPLLEKKYYDNCPGCKVEQAKELNRAVSIPNLFVIWMVVLCFGNH